MPKSILVAIARVLPWTGMALLTVHAASAQGEGDAAVATPAPAPPPIPAPSAPAFTPRPAPAFTPPPPPASDANADRVVLLPTAYTHPAGTLYFSTYDIAILQAGYAPTDSTQLSLTSSVPIEGLVLADVSVKSVIARDGPVSVAAIGSVTGIWGLDVGNTVLGRAGAVAEVCFDAACESSASMAATVLLGGPYTVAFTGAGFIWRVARWLSLLGEVDTALPTTLQAGRFNGVAVLPGIRFPHRTWALDLTFIRPLGVDNTPAVPLLEFTFRVLP